MLPKIIKNSNLFVEGGSFMGRADELVLPKLSRKMEEYRGAGMNAPVEIDMGSEKLEAEFSLKEFSKDILLQYGIVDSSGVAVRFRAAALREDSSGDTDAIEIVMRGRWRELDMGSLKAGDVSVMKVAVAVSYYKYILNGETLIELDSLNMVEKVGENDRLAEQRKALDIT
ncbi:MAG: phage major tail tube protein [Methyloprofundus sp.]|nr:phage major tail tube protein [Methyloprofundus sp.]